MVAVSTAFRFLYGPWRLLLQPRHVRKRSGLGSAPFARHYSGYRLFFLFLRVLRCFSSPGWLPPEADVGDRSPTGFPIRISMSQSPLATRHGFSQLAASFFAGRCQGILRVRSSAWSLNASSARADAVGNPRNRNDPPVRQVRCALHFLSLALLTSNQPPPSTGLAHGSALAEPEDICSAKARVSP